MQKPFIQVTITPRDNQPEGEMCASIAWGRYSNNGRTKTIDQEYFLESVVVPRPQSKPYRQWIADVINCVALANHQKSYPGRRRETPAEWDARHADVAEK